MERYLESPHEWSEKMSAKKPKLSIVSMNHYFRLVYRSALFLWLLFDYIFYDVLKQEDLTQRLEERSIALGAIWIVFVIEMIRRFFPAGFESPGCQKQFARNYIKSGKTEIIIPDNNATVLIALMWIGLNGAIGALHMLDILDDGVMILIASAYSVCDIICILFFCPFQTWFMKNKCCSVCRIYNWDYAMMFTPLFFVKKFYAWSLLALSFALLVRWEITFYRHPERFSENTNDYLQCRNCTEKLCAHKTQLHTLWKQIEVFTAERIKALKK